MTSRADVPALRFCIEGTSIRNPDPDDPQDIATATIITLGEETGHDPDQLLNKQDPEQRQPLKKSPTGSTLSSNTDPNHSARSIALDRQLPDERSYDPSGNSSGWASVRSKKPD